MVGWVGWVGLGGVGYTPNYSGEVVLWLCGVVIEVGTIIGE